MNEKEFDELLTEEAIDLNLQKKIKRKMNQKIYSKALITLIVCFLGFATLYYGNSFFLDITNYNPIDEQDCLEADLPNFNGFSFLYSTFYELQVSGVRTFGEWKTENLGFGKYKIPFQIEECFGKDRNGVLFRPTLDLMIENSKLRVNPYDTENMFIEVGPNFDDPQSKIKPSYQYTTQQVRNLVSEMPTSSYIDACISFKKIKSIEEIATLINAYPEATFDWIALNDQDWHYQDEETKLYHDTAAEFGIAINQDFLWPEVNEQYPCLSLFLEEITAETLTQHYLSCLKILIDNPEFLEVIDQRSKEDLLETLQNCYDKAQKELNAYGVRVFVKKDDLLKMMDELDISMIIIKNEKSSVFAK